LSLVFLKIKINLFSNSVNELLQVTLKSDAELVLSISIFNTQVKHDGKKYRFLKKLEG